MSNIDFTINPKQGELLYSVVQSCSTREYLYYAYGGAIRGGKTFAILGILTLLCRMFPDSKWIVIREDMTALKKTTIPSLEKIIRGSPNWKWSRNPANYHVTYLPTGAKIFFFGENISNDKDLETFLGLECNGLFLEQAEELTEAMDSMALQRAGSHIIPKMPPPFIFYSFNPTQKWVKKKFYDKYKSGQLLKPYKFIEAFPTDNPTVTKDQFDAWNRLDEISRRRMIEGDWNAYDTSLRWAYAFERKKHLWNCSYDPEHELYLSFDFNRNPICCIAVQEIDDVILVPFAFKLPNSDIYKLCAYIRAVFEVGGHVPLYRVTGDASGRGSTALVKDNLNYYTVIKQELAISSGQIQVPAVNPKLKDNQVLVNSVLQNAEVMIDPVNAEALIFDLENVQKGADGAIIKTDRNDPKQQADLLDCFRYWINQYKKKFLKMHVS